MVIRRIWQTIVSWGCHCGVLYWFRSLVVKDNFVRFLVCRPKAKATIFFLSGGKKSVCFVLQTDECCFLGFEWDRNFNVTLLVLRTFQLDGIPKRKETLLPTDSVDNYADSPER